METSAFLTKIYSTVCSDHLVQTISLIKTYYAVTNMTYNIIIM